MKIYHYNQFAYKGRVTQVFFRVNFKESQRILSNLPELPCPLIFRLLYNKWRINQHLSDNRNGKEFPVKLPCELYFFWKRYYSHFCSGRYLAVNSGTTSGNILLNVPINCPDQMSKLFNCLIESPVWSFIETITFRIIHNEPVKMSPVIVQVFDKTIQNLFILNKRG